MKNLLGILLFCSALLGQTAAPAKPAPEEEGSRKVREIIQKAVAALGGPAYLNYTSRTEQGRLYGFYHGQTRGVGVPFTAIVRYPDKDRFDFVAKRSVYPIPMPIGDIPVWVKDNLDVIVIHNGDKGYEVTKEGPVPEDPKDTRNFIRRREHSLDAVLRRWINEPGVAFFYDGKAIVDGKSADQVTVMNARNDAVTLYIDDTSHLPLKKTYSWRDPTDKARNTEEEIWDNYKNVGGIVTPHSLTRYYNGDMSHQRFLNTVTYNQDAPDTLFDATVATNTKAPTPRKH